MKQVKTSAIVLRRTNYGEVDRIVNILTPEGKVSVIAKGSRKEKSRLSSGIELFSVCDIVYIEGKSGVGTLTSARLTTFFEGILKDYDRLQFGYEAVKLVNISADQINERDWYDILLETLAALNTVTIPLKLVQVWFYLRFATMLGYELSLYHDVDGQKISENSRYRYNEQQRGLELFESGNINSSHIKLMRLISVKSIKTLIQIGGIVDILGDCHLLALEHASI